MNKHIYWKRPDFPLEVSILITDSCNFNCEHCCVKGRGINHNLSEKKIKEIIDEMYAHQVFNLNISGGEPFLHPRIFEILEYAERKEMKIHLNTNFTVLDDEMIKKLSKIKIAHIDISIHAFSEKGLLKFNKISGVINRLKHNIIFGLKNGLPLAFTTTLTKRNYQDIFSFMHFMKEKKINSFYLIGLLHPSGQGLLNFKKLCLGDRLLEKIYKKIINFSKKNYIKVVLQKRCNRKDFIGNLKEIEESVIKGNYGCPCGEYSCFIWPSGRITICPYGYDSFFVMGNINEKPLNKIWETTTMEWKRERIKKIKTKCIYFEKCLGGCPSDAYYLNGDINTCDSLCIFNQHGV